MAREQQPEQSQENMQPLDIEEGESLNREGKDAKKIQYAVSLQWERQQQNPPPQKCCTGTEEDLYRLCCGCSTRVGNLFFLSTRADGSPRLVAGPCWPFCTFVTVPLIVGLSALTLYYCILKSDLVPNWWIYLYAPLIVFTLIALGGVSCRDPGLMERITEEEEGLRGDSNAFLWNEQVGSFRPPDALYCRECKVLIQDYDHLCPWTGTGIGKKNMCCFKTFVISVNILCYSSIALTAYVLLKTDY